MDVYQKKCNGGSIMCEEVKEKKPLSIYCNSTQVLSSPYDFAIALRHNTLTSNDLLVEVTMSPEHTKVFAKMLLRNVEEYERTFGIIPDVSPKVISELAKSGKVKFESDQQ